MNIRVNHSRLLVQIATDDSGPASEGSDSDLPVVISQLPKFGLGLGIIQEDLGVTGERNVIVVVPAVVKGHIVHHIFRELIAGEGMSCHIRGCRDIFTV